MIGSDERGELVGDPETSDFPLDNLPFGVGRLEGRTPPVIAIGDAALDVVAAAQAGLLDGAAPAGIFEHATLNAFLGAGRPVWRAVRSRVAELFTDAAVADRVLPHLLARRDLPMVMPVAIADFADFYSSLHHAMNLGAILRPGADPLPPAWRHIPIGYHGRSGTVVVSDTPVRRPWGARSEDGHVVFGPSRQLDFELEVGFIVGAGSERGCPVGVDDADEHVFGIVLLNDWSARDVQAFEYQPLGPFLGKSFATSISPWIVPLDAVAARLMPAPRQEPRPAEYLVAQRDRALPLELVVELNETTITKTSFADMYWTFAQQLAHMTANGASLRCGDLYGSETVSGPHSDQRGSLMEITWRGTDPVALNEGGSRTFLEDGDTVTMRGSCVGAGGSRLGFGELTGTIIAAREMP